MAFCVHEFTRRNGERRVWASVGECGLLFLILNQEVRNTNQCSISFSYIVSRFQDLQNWNNE